MAGTARSDNPGGREPVPLHRREPVGGVRELQRKLWAAAEQSSGRRFHALYDRICRDDVLVEAWERVRSNRGAAGVDRVTLEAVEVYGVERMLGELARDLRAGTYRAAPVRRVEIRDFFGRIDHDLLMVEVERRVSDRRVLAPLRSWLRAGVLDGGVFSETVTGSPQGGVISSLMSNIYLHAFDRAWAEHGTGELVRYADDFVVLCRSASEAEEAGRLARALLGGLGLELHPDRTRVVDLREGREGFDFLGCRLHARMSGRLWEQKRVIRYYLHRWPSMRSMKRARQRIKDLTDRRRVGMELGEIIAVLNLFLRGWGNDFRTGNASAKFRQLDRHVTWRLKRLLIKKRGRNLRAGQAGQWTEAWFHDQGLHQLLGTIRYPKAA